MKILFIIIALVALGILAYGYFLFKKIANMISEYETYNDMESGSMIQDEEGCNNEN